MTSTIVSLRGRQDVVADVALSESLWCVAVMVVVVVVVGGGGQCGCKYTTMYYSFARV